MYLVHLSQRLQLMFKNDIKKNIPNNCISSYELK